MKRVICNATIFVILLASLALVGCDGGTTRTNKSDENYTTRYEFNNKTTTRYKSDGDENYTTKYEFKNKTTTRYKSDGDENYTTRYEYKNKTTTRYKSDGYVNDIDKNGKVDNKEWEKQWKDYLNKQYDKYGV